MQAPIWSVLSVDTFGAKHVLVNLSVSFLLVIQRGKLRAKGRWCARAYICVTFGASCAILQLIKLRGQIDSPSIMLGAFLVQLVSLVFRCAANWIQSSYTQGPPPKGTDGDLRKEKAVKNLLWFPLLLQVIFGPDSVCIHIKQPDKLQWHERGKKENTILNIILMNS